MDPKLTETEPEIAVPNRANDGSERVLVLEAGRSAQRYWRDIWDYRELFGILAWRDVSVQYKQTVIGVSWAILRPLLTMIVFTVLFGRLGNLPSDGQAPYPVMVMAGMLAWFLFSTVLSQASNSLIQNTNLISKVYFPRLIVPAASSVVALVDALFTLVVLFLLMFWFGFFPNWQIAFLPLFFVFGMLAPLGPALILAALNVKYRDFRFIVPFVVQFGLYVSPVGFSSSVVPDQWRLLYSLNPAVGVIDGFRWCLLGGQSELYLPGLAVSVLSMIVFLWVGIKSFRSVERTFADLI